MFANVEWESAEQGPALEWLMESGGLTEASVGSYLGAAGGGALQGATAGAALGPYGALAGGLIGATAGIVGTATSGRRRRPAPARRPTPPPQRPPARGAAPPPSQQPAPAQANTAIHALVAQLQQLLPALAAAAGQTAGQAPEPQAPADPLAGILQPESFETSEDIFEMMPELTDDEVAYGDFASDDEAHYTESESGEAEAFSPVCDSQNQAAGY